MAGVDGKPGDCAGETFWSRLTLAVVTSFFVGEILLGIPLLFAADWPWLVVALGAALLAYLAGCLVVILVIVWRAVLA